MTIKEKCLLSYIVGQVQMAMEWDEDLQAYADGGRILISLDEDEYKTLVKLNEKL